MPYLSICIPTYEMKDQGRGFLKQSLDILAGQTFKDFNVVISDHSKNDEIKNLCQEYKNNFDIRYYRNPDHVGSSSANINNAIKHATGKLIKILFQDDFLYSPTSLDEIVKNFDLEKDKWLVTACEYFVEGENERRRFYPRYNDKIQLGNNTISSPSVLTIKNDDPLLFDENLLWLMDCDYYKRCFDKYGAPKILNAIGVVNRNGAHQVSQTLANEPLRKKEHLYILKKYCERANVISQFYQFAKKYKKYFIWANYRDVLRKARKPLYKKSYAQAGEDLLVKYIFDARGIQRPSYIDIGAHDPVEINNTKMFYDCGSSGINIEPNPELYKKFLKQRRRDINLNVGIAETAGEKEFYIFSSPSLSTFSKDEAETLAREPGLSIVRIQKTPVITLQEILNKYLHGRFPDFLNIDVEGWDEKILRSIDFSWSAPKVICVETITYSTTGHGKKDRAIIEFLQQKGYLLYADTNINSIFVKKEFWEI